MNFDFTVFTPTYNRRHTLNRVFQSLKKAGSVRFEWLIVDDGSNDGTCEFIDELAAVSPFEIVYFFKDNGGKHSAHNFAIERARGSLFVVLDSDDEIFPGALDSLFLEWNSVERSDKRVIAGILGNSVDERGSIVGAPFPSSGIEGSNFYLSTSGAMIGDKLPCYSLEILKKHPFPILPIRTVVPEGVVWNAIGRTHVVVCVNKSVRIYHRSLHDDASLMNSYRDAGSNAAGKFMYSVSSLNYSDLHFLQFPMRFVKDAINCTRFFLHARHSFLFRFFAGLAPANLLLVAVFVPVGLLVWIVDKSGQVIRS